MIDYKAASKIILILVSTFIVNTAFADTTVKVTYQRHFEMKAADFIKQVGKSDFKYVCGWNCTKKYVYIYVFKNRDTNEELWAWTADRKMPRSYNKDSMTYDFTLIYDDDRQILSLNDHHGDYLINEVVEEKPAKRDPIDWKEIRRRTQESIDAHKNDR